MKAYLPVVFAVLTAFFWGCYGPVLAESRPILKSPFKPYVLIGVAYLLWGIVGGLIGMQTKGDNYEFPTMGIVWGFFAGSLGAWGAYTLTLAMYSGGKPYVVMPIVFGGAVTVSAIVSALRETEHSVSPMLWLGVLGILVCSVIVAYNTPHAAPAPPGKPAAAATPAQNSQADSHRPS